MVPVCYAFVTNDSATRANKIMEKKRDPFYIFNSVHYNTIVITVILTKCVHFVGLHCNSCKHDAFSV
jgi:hypothetical protein